MSIIPQITTVAPLTNVAIMQELVGHLRTRKPDLPGIGCFYGFSGYGKTIATTYAVNKLDDTAVYVEVRSTWTRKKFVEALLQELTPGIRYGSRPTYDLIEIAAERLMVGRMVLFVDEADFVVDRGYAEVIRDIYELAKTPIVLIGEEDLPVKLERYERLHNRMARPAPAQPCSIDDARHLTRLYCDQVKVADDLLAHLVAEVNGCTRRVAANLDDIQEEALKNGWEDVNRKLWGDRKFNTGSVTTRRRSL